MIATQGRWLFIREKNYKKILKKKESKKSSQIEAFQQLFDSKYIKKAKKPITSVVKRTIKIIRKMKINA